MGFRVKMKRSMKRVRRSVCEGSVFEWQASEGGRAAF